MFIPTLLLKKLYTLGSLTNVEQGVRFAIKNRLSNAEVTDLVSVAIDSHAIPRDAVAIHLGDSRIIQGSALNPEAPIEFPLGAILTLVVQAPHLPPGKHTVEIAVKTAVRELASTSDSIQEETEQLVRSPGRKG
jgi:hydroxymethylglutaryl-CoA reductase (NADPH)